MKYAHTVRSYSKPQLAEVKMLIREFREKYFSHLKSPEVLVFIKALNPELLCLNKSIFKISIIYFWRMT